MPAELEKVIPAPTHLIYLWNWLNEQVHPLSYTELEAWKRLTGRDLSMWEVKAMIELDRVRSYG